MAEKSDGLGEIVGGLYEASVDAGRWPPAWEAVGRWLGGSSGTLFLEDASGRRFRVLVPANWTEKAVELHASRSGTVAPSARCGNGHLLAHAASGGATANGAREERSEIWTYSGFHNGEMGHFLLAGIRVEGPVGAAMGFRRPPDSRPFKPAECERLHRLLPHLKRALELGWRIGQERDDAAVLASAFGHSEVAVIVVNADGRIMFASATAERALASGGLALGGHRRELTAETADQKQRLRELINDAARGGAGGAMLIARAAGAPLAVIVSRLPVAPERLPGQAARLLAVVTLRSLGDPSNYGAARLSRLFGLTAAETEVAAGLEVGQSVVEIASRRCVSALTVRAQIRQLLEKCRAENMQGLVRLLAPLS